MKPTKEIIKLAKKLKELGYRQVIKNGDWMIGSLGFLCLWNGDCPPINPVDHYEPMPIPSLEDGLLWLKEKQDPKPIGINNLGLGKWTCTHDWDTLDSHAEADSPHEAVLKAMIKVMESK